MHIPPNPKCAVCSWLHSVDRVGSGVGGSAGGSGDRGGRVVVVVSIQIFTYTTRLKCGNKNPGVPRVPSPCLEPPRFIRVMSKNSYIGERALLFDEPRTATVEVVSSEASDVLLQLNL